MATIIYIVGLVLAVLAVIDIIKKPISMVGKVICSVIVLCTDPTEVPVSAAICRKVLPALRLSCSKKKTIFNSVLFITSSVLMPCSKILNI